MAIHGGFFSTIRSRNGRGPLRLDSVDLNVNDLGRFLRQTIQTFSSDSDLTRSARFHCEALLHCVSQNEGSMESCREELENCASILSSFLAALGEHGKVVPSTVVFEAHSLMGCMQHILKQHKLASLSFLRALWIASVTPNVPSELLAITLHRLGRAYSETGQYSEAQQILQKALAEYKVANVHRNHAIVVDASCLLVSIEQKLKLQQRQGLNERTRRSAASARTLTLIREDAAAERRGSV